MKLAISIGSLGGGPDESDARFVQAAESLGVERAWSAEAWGRDAVSPIAYLAAVTSRITLGTGIMQVSSRTPVMTAMTALTLAELTGDRFILGLGVSGPQVVEGLHGTRFQPALTRLKETVEIVRLAFRGERIRYAGKVYELPRPGGEGLALRLDHPPRPEIPIHLATIAPRALEYTGAAADGWLGTSFSPDHPDAHLAHLRRGAQRVGRALDALEMQVTANVAIGDDVEALAAPLKPGVAFQLGAMGSARTNFYNDAFRRAGFEDDARAVQRLWRDGKRDAAARRVPDALVLDYGLIGTPAMVRERVTRYREAGISAIHLRFPGRGDLAERIGALERAVGAIRG